VYHNRFRLFVLTIASFCFAAVFNVARADDNLRVLPAKVNGVEPRDMLQQRLRQQVTAAFEQWQKDYEQRTDPAFTLAFE